MIQLRIHQEILDDTLVLSLRGQLDALTSDMLAETSASPTCAAATYIILDLNRLSLIDSSGVGSVVALLKQTRARGGDTLVAAVAQQPMEVFKILNLDKSIKIYETVALAIADIPKRPSKSEAV